MLRIATWNVNSIRVRWPQVRAWLQENIEQERSIDVLCLQETKVEDVDFPEEEVLQAGYCSAFHGQKSYNGVAMLYRSAWQAEDVVKAIPGFEDEQKRVLAITLAGRGSVTLRIICAYFPNGEDPQSEKFAYKLAWMQHFTAWVKSEMAQHPYLAVLGDFNIAPEDRDAHREWTGKILTSPAERQGFVQLQALGLRDALRVFSTLEQQFTWWDYRYHAFRRNLGMRIDHILLSEPLAALATDCTIDVQARSHPRPSDHTPVTVSIAEKAIFVG